MISLRYILFKYAIRHPFRYLRIRKLTKQVININSDLLSLLGSDYDINGKPYWDKSGE